MNLALWWEISWALLLEMTTEMEKDERWVYALAVPSAELLERRLARGSADLLGSQMDAMWEAKLVLDLAMELAGEKGVLKRC